jgi:DNA helicase-4
MKTFSPGWLARLLAGLEHGQWRLDATSLSGPGMPDPQKKYRPDECLGTVRAEPGFPWSRVVLDLTHKKMVIGGFNRRAAAEWADALNEWQRLARFEALEPTRKIVKSRIATAKELWSGKQFVRHSDHVRVLNGLNEALDKIKNDPLWLIWSDDNDRSMVARLSALTLDQEARRRDANDAFCETALKEYAKLFDEIESKPLTDAQRLACVVDDDNNLVLAGAGSGKTSVMIGRIAYMLTAGHATADKILAVAYNRAAAEELRERVDARLGQLESKEQLTIRTFHSLGTMIIAEAEGRKPTVSVLATDERARLKFFQNEFDSLLKDAQYQELYIDFVFNYEESFKTIFEFADFVAYENDAAGRDLRAINGILVKSVEEKRIANWLLRHGVHFSYEAPYPTETATVNYAEYKPDFTIYESPKSERCIFLEHFGIDENGEPPKFFSERQRVRYKQGIQWKRELHVEKKTILIQTFSHQFRNDRIFDLLKEHLEANGVTVNPIDPTAALDLVAQNEITDNFVKLGSHLITVGRELNSFVGLEEKIAVLPLHGRNRCEALWRTLKPLLEAYEYALHNSGELDFPEMLSRAKSYVETGRFKSPYSQILVDEFQDISGPRAGLVKALRDHCRNASLFAVGDDWQSIYRFSGSDVRFTSEFSHRVGPATVVSLDKTCRFNDKIGSVATRFVSKNPAQTRKRVESIKFVKQPAVSLVPSADEGRALMAVLDKLSGWAKLRGSLHSVRILARYNYELDEARGIVGSFDYSGSLDIIFSTIHSSKGLEADFIIILGLESGRNGFPAEKPSDEFIDLLMPSVEAFPHSEERRLFYVALTRARHRVYLIYDLLCCSSFLSELIDDGYFVAKDEFRSHSFHQNALPRVSCGRCATGALLMINGEMGQFVGCNNFPRCPYTEAGCDICGAILLRIKNYRVCSDINCSGISPACADCGSPMQRKQGRFGWYYRCGNYRRRHLEVWCPARSNVLDLPEVAVLRASHDGSHQRN